MRDLFAGVACVLFFFAVRLMLLEVVPPFIDEAYVLDMGRTMTETSLLHQAAEGRTFSAWYWLLLQAPYGAPFFVARYANLLIIVVGLAAAMGLARMAGGTIASLATAVLLTFSHFHTFYDAFGNTEPLLTGFVMVSLLMSYRITRRTNRADAIMAGGALFIACGMKVSALPFVALPGLAVLLVNRGTFWERVRWGLWAYGTFAVLYGLFLGIHWWQGYQPLALLLRASGGGVSLGARTQAIAESYFSYMGGLIGGLLLMCVVFLLLKRRFFIVAALIVPAATLWLSGGYFTRYLYPYMSVLLVCAGVAIGLLRRPVPVALLGVGLLVWWSGFAFDMVNNPSDLSIPQRDYIEHYASEASGSGLLEIIAFLEMQPSQPVIGLLANCDALFFATLDTLDVTCPSANPNGEDLEALEALVDSNRAAGGYVVQENVPFVPQVIPGEVVYTFERPGALTKLTVYRLLPLRYR